MVQWSLLAIYMIHEIALQFLDRMMVIRDLWYQFIHQL